MKRVTYWPVLFNGLAHNWGVFVGFASIMGFVDLKICLPLYISGVVWTIISDTMYTHQDKEDDIRTGVKSLALRWGEKTDKFLTVCSFIFGYSTVYMY